MAHLDYMVGEQKHVKMVLEWVMVELVDKVVFVVSVVFTITDF